MRDRNYFSMQQCIIPRLSFDLLLDLDLQAKTREKSLWTADLRIRLVRINISPFYLV